MEKITLTLGSIACAAPGAHDHGSPITGGPTAGGPTAGDGLTAGRTDDLPCGHRLERPKRYLARFVRAGLIKGEGNRTTDIFMTAQALQAAAAAGMFNNKAVFLNHAAWLENPSLERLVGKSLGSRYNPADQSIEGEIELYNTPAAQIAAQVIAEILSDRAAAPDIGLSIVFYPIWQYNEAAGERSITGIHHIESIDLVFQPAADGRILQALSGVASGRTAAGGLAAAFGDPTPAFRSSRSLTPAPSAGLRLSKGTSMEPNPIRTQDPGRQAGDSDPYAWSDAIAAAGTDLILSACGLPEHARQRLAAQHYATPDELTAAIEAERAYLASVQENRVVQIGGQPPRGGNISGVRTSLDRVSLALEALMSGSQPPAGVPPLTGIRELYHLLSGDYEMTGLFQQERVTFANVNSSTMANLVANVLNKRVAAEFQNYNMWWQPIVLEEDFQTLQAIKWTILGGVGELPTVAEGAAYTELTWDDSAESGTFVKKGGYLGLTLEAIDKDETGRVRGAPRALAQAAWLTISKAVSGIFTQSSGVGPTLSDSYALFEAAHHANLGSTALSLSSWNAARLAMRKQTELNSGERLGALTTPKYLLVPPDLEMTALQVLATESDYTYALSNGQAAPVNPNAQGNTFDERLNVARKRVIVVDLWTDTNDWAALADPRMYPTVGVGYRYGRTPEIFSIASPTAGLMFTNDTLPVKVRYFFAVAPIDYRGMYKANVA